MRPGITGHGPSALADVLSDLGQELSSCHDYSTVAANAASLVSNVLGVAHVAVLRLRSPADALLLQGGVGWPADAIGRDVFPTDPNTLTGFALSSNDPVVVEDFRTESRFTIPSPLKERKFVAGVCIRIPCAFQSFGVLGVFSTEPRTFSQDDLSSLEVVAGMLAVSSGCQNTGDLRREDQENIAQAKHEWEATVDALPHFICLIGDGRRIVRANRAVEQWVNRPMSDVLGHSVHGLLHPGCDAPSCGIRDALDVAWDAVMNGRHVVREIKDEVLNRCLEIQVRPTSRRSDGSRKDTSLAVLVLQDITRIKHAEEVLKNSNSKLESIVRERTMELLQANEMLTREVDERRRIEKELRRSENDMRLLSAQLLTAQEMERKRIASELHDGIGQSLTAIKFRIEHAVGLGAGRVEDGSEEVLRAIIPRMQAAIEEVRRISMNLRPPTLDSLGIIPTIAWFCREFRSVYPDVQLDTEIAIEEQDVSAPLKTTIYRILQEALNNVIKHSQAASVSLVLRKSESSIELLVQDHGTGFDTEDQARCSASEKGFGIAGMRERTEFSGGAFSIASSESRGTIVRSIWPCVS